MGELNIVKDELIGRQVKIKKCTDPNWVNVSGIVIDETKNTFIIEFENKQKRIAKNTAIFEFEYEGKRTIVDGSQLLFRPADRIKKAR